MNAILAPKVIHFYYCFLISIRLRKKYMPSLNDKENFRLSKSWLRTAQEKKLFDPVIHIEITWLMSETTKRSFPDFENMILKVYKKGKAFVERCNEKNNEECNLID